MPETHLVTLTAHAYGGESLGRLPDGRAVFVPFALPGETARIRLVEEKRGFARGEVVELLAASPERAMPRCVHFTVCGGCHYQHAAYPAQLAAKTAILEDQLQRIGGLANPPVEAAVPCPNPYGYRNRVQFHLTPQGKLGYHRLRSEEVFAIRECHLPEDALASLWPLLDFEPLPGLERVDLRLGVGEDVLLTLESGDPEPPEMTVEELPISVVHLGPGGARVLAGSDHVVLQVLGRLFRVSAGSFFQVNTPMAEAMVEHLLAHLPVGPAETLLDVYAGVGLFSAFLAPKVGRLIAIEASPGAGEDFVANLDEFENVELYLGAAEQVLPGLQARPRAAVLDPPRAGLDRRALDGLLALGPQTVAYVSCDPATLARDARRLSAGGYRLRRATPFDLFPQTAHIESISFWERA